MYNQQLEHKHHSPMAQPYPFVLLADDIDTPANIGSLFRMGDALGVAKLYLCGRSVSPPNIKLSKVARSTDKVLPFEYHQDALALVDTLRAEAYRIVCLELSSRSMALDQFTASQSDKICLILGSENTGVRQALLDTADVTLHIPMLGQNSSMNVANACAIAVYHITGIYR